LKKKHNLIYYTYINIKSKRMYKSLELLPCKKCNRLIESNRLEFHTLMCSTAYLRQSYNRKSKFK